MGTNYYCLDENPDFEKSVITQLTEPQFLKTHIGKSSYGWCFSLHVIPENNLNNLNDWMKYLESKLIINEYDDVVSFDDLIKIIVDRSKDSRRHEIDYYNCVGHGEGTWDLIKGEFM